MGILTSILSATAVAGKIAQAVLDTTSNNSFYHDETDTMYSRPYECGPLVYYVETNKSSGLRMVKAMNKTDNNVSLAIDDSAYTGNNEILTIAPKSVYPISELGTPTVSNIATFTASSSPVDQGEEDRTNSLRRSNLQLNFTNLSVNNEITIGDFRISMDTTSFSIDSLAALVKIVEVPYFRLETFLGNVVTGKAVRSAESVVDLDSSRFQINVLFEKNGIKPEHAKLYGTLNLLIVVDSENLQGEPLTAGEIAYLEHISC